MQRMMIVCALARKKAMIKAKGDGMLPKLRGEAMGEGGQEQGREENEGRNRGGTKGRRRKGEIRRT